MTPRTQKRSKPVTWQYEQTTLRTWQSSRLTLHLKLCLRVIWTCCWSNYLYDWTQQRLEISTLWVGIVFLTLDFLNEFVQSAYLSFNENFQQLTVCFCYLSLSKNIRAVVSYDHQSTILYLLDLSVVSLLRLLLLQAKWYRRRLLMTMQWSLRFYTASLNSHNNVSWTQLNPCFSSQPSTESLTSFE